MSKIILTEFEIKNILNQHKLNLTENVLISDIFDDVTSSDNKNVQRFIEFLNGNVMIDDIIKDIIGDIPSDIKVGSHNLSDDQFYEKILNGVGAKPTKENMKFFYAWRQGEGGTAAFNPFNTTQKKSLSTFYNCLKKDKSKCQRGVRNYSSEQEGISATIETLNNGNYDCVINGLKNDIGAKKIATNCMTDLKTWGTGGLIKTILDGSSLNPPKISRLTTKKVS